MSWSQINFLPLLGHPEWKLYIRPASSISVSRTNQSLRAVHLCTRAVQSCVCLPAPEQHTYQGKWSPYSSWYVLSSLSLSIQNNGSKISSHSGAREKEREDSDYEFSLFCHFGLLEEGSHANGTPSFWCSTISDCASLW